MTDEQLMAKFQATKDQRYMDVIYRRHKDRITDYLTKEWARGGRELGDRLAQETFRRAMERRFRGGPVSGWLIMIATTVGSRFLRSDRPVLAS